MLDVYSPGTVIGDRFRIERVAGVGGMGVVYCAQDQSMGSIVALKMLLDGHSDAYERFTREAQLLAQLDHPAIVRHVAHGMTDDGAAWLAMEWLEGEDLAQRIAREGLRVSESLLLAERLADALGQAHACGVVHRDIKPSNVFLPASRPQDAKILDFGIARPLSSRTALTRTGTILGTPGYMAPEQLEGNAAIDARADVFSLGSVLFECLTGKPAFAGEHVMAVLARLLLEDAPRVNEFRSDVPESVVDLVARMLSRDRDNRPVDGFSVRRELLDMRHITGEPPAQNAITPSITGSEQRLLCVVVALMDAGRGPDNALDATVQSTLPPSTLDALRAALSAMNVRVDEVAGALLVSLTGTSNPSDQAARAARCALVMRTFLQGTPMMIATGRGDGSGRLPVGPVVDRAATFLEQTRRIAADKDTETQAAIYLDDVTRALLDVRFEIAETAVGVELLGEREVGEASRSLLGRVTPCVGRERELAVLQGLIDDMTSEECARAALVTGPAGIGKSRIRYEIVRRLRDRFPQLTIWVGRADQIRSGSAYFLIGSALRHAAAMTGTETAEVRRKKIVELTSVVRSEERARIAAFLGEIVGEPFSEESTPMLRVARADASVMANEVRRAFEDFMEAIVDRGPVCLVLEDLHWADVTSVRFLDRMLDTLRERPLAVIAFARPDVHEAYPRIFAERNVDEIRLGELGRKAAERLIKHAMSDQVDAATVTKIVDRAAGNAFFLEEMIRAVAERRGDTLPETVLGMVEARLDSLSTVERRVLRAASILGETFWASAVAELANDDRDVQDTVSILDKLAEREVLRKSSGSRIEQEKEYSFRHALLRDGAYAMLTDADRVLGHKIVAAWLEKVGETDSIVLAEHWEHAKELGKAADYFARASEQSLRLGDLRLALSRTERGFACQPENDARVALSLVASEALAFLGEPSESTKHLECVLELTQPGTRSHTLALAAIVYNTSTGDDTQKFLDTIPLLMSVEPTADARGTFAWALSMVTESMAFAGQLEMSEHFLMKLQGLVAQAEGDPVPAIWLDQAQASHALVLKQDPFFALGLYSRAEEAFAQVGQLNQAAYAQVQVVGSYAALGAYDKAARLLERDKIRAASPGVVDGLRLFFHVFLLRRQGKTDEAIAAGRATLVAVEGQRFMSTMVHLALVHAFIEQGTMDAADEHLRLFREIRVPMGGDDVVLDTLEAAIMLGRKNFQGSLSNAERAIAARDETTMYGTHVPLAYVVRARAQMALGQTDAARTGIIEARSWLLVQADKVHDPELRETFLTRISEHAQIMGLASQLGV